MSSPDNVSVSVYQAMADTFEGMAFVQISRQEEEPPKTDDPGLIWSRVDVKSPGEGFLIVAYTKDMGINIVEAMYGAMEEPYPDEMILDTLKEIVNTVVGRCLSLLVPEGQTFELGIPDVGNEWPDVGEAEVYAFSTMDGGSLLAAADLKALDLRETSLAAESSQEEPSSGDGWGESSQEEPSSDDGWGSSDGWG